MSSSDVFRELREIGCERIELVADADTGLRAVVAIHSTVLGPAGGGVRFWRYEDDGAAMLDAARLARAMTLKYAAAGVDLGGGKAVIVDGPGVTKDEALLRAFGRFVQGLGGAYYAAEDVGTTPADIEQVYRETEYVVALPEHLGGPGDVAPLTALGAVEATRACLEHARGNADLEGVGVALQGLGAVGGAALRLMVEAGADVVVADVDEAKVARAQEELGVRAVAPDAIYEQDVDVFAPYALGEVINDATLPRLRAPVVAGGANNVFAARRHAQELQRRGGVYAVDFVANSGGTVFDQEMVYERERTRREGFRTAEAEERVRRIFDRTREVLELGDRRAITYMEAAEQLALDRLRRAA